MPITLLTGLPGNAKTLFGLQSTIKRAHSENRDVYYFGLKEFKEDDPRLLGTKWTLLDPVTWHETVPPGSLIFGDEAQKVFRSRSLGTVPPKYVTELEEHRHKGLDFVFITQHPSLIDPAIRKLTQVHQHMVRISGFEASTVHQWNEVRETCDKPSGRKDSEKTKWAFAKDLYGLYKSADVHTIKRKIPVRWIYLLVFALAIIGIFSGLAIYFKGKTEKAAYAPSAVAGVAQSSGVSASMQPSSQIRQSADPIGELKDYVWRETPRVSGLPHTAPKYDSITAPVRAPVPAACIQIGNVRTSKRIDCKCFTQQGTPMAVEFSMCVEFARNGCFQDFDADSDARQSDRMVASQQVMSGHQDVSMGPLGTSIRSFEHPAEPSRIRGRTN